MIHNTGAKVCSSAKGEGAEVDSAAEGAGVEVRSATEGAVRGTQSRRKQGAEIRRGTEGTVRRYTVRHRVQCVSELRYAVQQKEKVCWYAEQQKDTVRICAFQAQKGCGYPQVYIGEVADLS